MYTYSVRNSTVVSHDDLSVILIGSHPIEELLGIGPYWNNEKQLASRTQICGNSAHLAKKRFKTVRADCLRSVASEVVNHESHHGDAENAQRRDSTGPW